MSEKRKPIAVFDVETDPFKHGRREKPFLCGWYDGKSYRLFRGADCVRQMWSECASKFDGYVYAHSGGKFDFKFLLPHLPKKPLEIFNIRGRIASIRTARAEFRDSYLLIPVPLAAYGKKEIDIWKLEAEHRGKHAKEIEEYLRVDCYSLHEMLTEFTTEHGIGLTLAGRTFAILKEKFGMKPPHANEWHDTTYRNFYYGGRVQFWELGRLKGKFQIFDINSAYPWAMKFEHAFSTKFTVTEKLPTSEEKLLRGFVEFTGTAIDLPWRGEDGALNFTERKGEFNVTGWEFVAALKAGRVKVDEILAFHGSKETRDFGGFVDYFYKQKAAAETPGARLFAKLILNSAYGRFALNPKMFRDVLALPLGDDWNEEENGEQSEWEIAQIMPEIGLVIWERPAEVNRNSYYNVATAASITGCVRAYLLESMAKCRRVVYCDTDSVMVENGDALTKGGKLGEWKHEGETVNGGLHIAGKKLYAAKLTDGTWKTASKGVDLSPEQICKVAGGQSMTSTFDAPTFSLLSGERWITRTVRRADKRKANA